MTPEQLAEYLKDMEKDPRGKKVRKALLDELSPPKPPSGREKKR